MARRSSKVTRNKVTRKTAQATRRDLAVAILALNRQMVAEATASSTA